MSCVCLCVLYSLLIQWVAVSLARETRTAGLVYSRLKDSGSRSGRPVFVHTIRFVVVVVGPCMLGSSLESFFFFFKTETCSLELLCTADFGI